jgi:basic membrane protein A
VCWLDDPAGNIHQACYKEHEGSFLVGMIAAMASESGTIGFVGGMDVPLIRKFQGGYEQGAQYVNPDIQVIANMTGTTPEAWNNPTKGAELTKAQVDGGADVVYQAAGGTGIGVLQAAADADIMAIGVDTNQNWMHPGNMLTSMLKRLDLQIFQQAEKTAAGTFEAEIVVYGLAEGMLGYATEDGMVTDEMIAATDAAVAAMADGSLEVADWSQE